MSRRVALVLTSGVALTGLITGLPASSAAVKPSAHLTRALQGGDSGDFPGAEVPVGDADRRGPRLPATAGGKAAVARLGKGVQATWTQYGTPLVLTRDHAFLATGLAGTPAQVARTFLARNAAVYGISAADVSRLELVSAEALPDSTTAWAVVLRQKVAGLRVAEDGLVTVGVGAGGQVAYVTSSLVPSALLSHLTDTAPTLSPQSAVLAAAEDAGITGLDAADLSLGKVDAAGFQLIRAKGLHQVQRTRLRVLPTTKAGARLVYETDVSDVAGGRALAAISFVDADNGAVLLRRDAVDTFADSTRGTAGMRAVGSLAAAPSGGQFSGAYTEKACGPKHLLAVPAGSVTLSVVAIAALPTNDIVLRILRNGKEIVAADNATSPEAATVTLVPPAVATDRFEAEVCPFGPTSVSPVQMPPYDYVGSYVTSDTAPPSAGLPGPLTDGTQSGPSIFHVFGSNPTVPLTMAQAKDTRYKACSGKKGDPNLLGKDVAGCDYVYADGSPLPYDSDPILGLPTFTTIGNNAVSSDARASSSLTPGAPFVTAVSPTRDYQPPWTDSWHVSDCDPASIAGPNQSDVQTAIVNLFTGHNRTHDFAYRLGLTEKRGALQLSNFGKGGAEGDPELGNAQNAALSQEAFAAANGAPGPAGGQVPLTGRNNANQITMQDGVPGITNQYLFQPIPTFHGPCADGDLDSGIFIHEYTHAISNRLIAGPDTGLSGQQGGSMGESWSDLVAVEYLNAFGLAGTGGEHPTALGAYATGNVFKGIRDYNADPKNNPLNYSDFGFDATGPEVHADGEIWNAVQMTVRQALIDKYNGQFPYDDKVLQKSCAVGRTVTGAVGPSWDKCPGNRRYVTYLFDAMIGQANGSPSMVDMKNVELASVLLRDKDDYDTVAEAFAQRGLGKGASSASSGDTDPTPSFAAPRAADNANVTFSLLDASTGKPVKGSVFVGMYSARCNAVATTLGGDEVGPKATITKGTYTFTVQARGYGIQRFTVTLVPGAKTQVFRLAQNLASRAYSPTVTSNAGALRIGDVLDDSEETNGAFDKQPVAGREITVAFARPKQTFDRIAVSALHHVAKKLPEGGTEIEGRFLGVRAFDLQASSDGGKTFSTVYRSASNFFPAQRPRPVAPDLIAREVRLPKPVTADAVRLVIRSSQCTGNPEYSTEEEADPIQPSACTSVAGYPTQVTVTELEVFKGNSTGPIMPVAAPVSPPRRINERLAATGGSTALGLGGLVLIGLAGAAFAYRRRLG